MIRNAQIAASGMFVPERVIPNSFFNELLGEDVDTWLRENLTIKERRWCNEDQSTADLCVEAAKIILKNANTSARELDLIIIATDTPEYISPSTTSVVQYRLGAVKAGTFDVNTACAGFVTALDIASKYIRSDKKYNKVLVIGAYAMSKYLNMQDKKTVTLFADGAAGVLLRSIDNENEGFLTSSLYTEGQYADWMGIYAGGTHQPVTPKVLENKDHLLKFVKKFPKETNPITWTRMIKEACDDIKINPKDINHYFITQININSIWETLDNLGVERSKGHTIMEYFGYTGSACIPMAFDDANRKGLIKKGDLVLFIGSGGGLAFALSIFKI
ncbi:MAG TPA: ketoacyl-ACP synthase III [Ignavibacteriaceae bacterium]|nr:ketoacyl-ACP synthase III [Ignavibacteriaceae bacterium]